ncbi:MAG: DUF4065 domain-containing protein [Rhodobacteraceae bacterium]|nr:DUF4065 domain-containing protein [Paracoccaceae bacterium]
MHSSLIVAQYLLNKAGDIERSLTPMQIIKLVYLCHGWMLGLYRRPLIEDDVEAWRYGPVIRRLYGAVKHYRSDPIAKPLMPEADVADALAAFDKDERNIMDQVFNIYGKYTGIELSKLTHAPGTPWSEIRSADDTGWEVIPDHLIKDHFRELAQQP